MGMHAPHRSTSSPLSPAAAGRSTWRRCAWSPASCAPGGAPWPPDRGSPRRGASPPRAAAHAPPWPSPRLPRRGPACAARRSPRPGRAGHSRPRAGPASGVPAGATRSRPPPAACHPSPGAPAGPAGPDARPPSAGRCIPAPAARRGRPAAPAPGRRGRCGLEQGGHLVVGVGHPLLPCRGGVAGGAAFGEGIARRDAAPAQAGVEAAGGGQAGLDGGRGEAATLQLPEVDGGRVGVGVEQVLPRAGRQKRAHPGPVAPHRGVGDGGPGRAEGAEPGLGQAPEGLGVAVVGACMAVRRRSAGERRSQASAPSSPGVDGRAGSAMAPPPGMRRYCARRGRQGAYDSPVARVAG